MIKDHKKEGERFGSVVRFFAGAIVFVVIPVWIYQFIVTDPVFGVDEYGDPVQFGFHLVFILYSLVLYLHYELFKMKKKLNRLLDKIFSKEGLEQVIEISERERSSKKTSSLFQKEKEKRVEWFIL